eukprot:5227457-Amphidinium_carterae.1
MGKPSSELCGHCKVGATRDSEHWRHAPNANGPWDASTSPIGVRFTCVRCADASARAFACSLACQGTACLQLSLALA